MLLDWLPSVTLNELAVSARNAATLGKLNAPVPRRKLLLRNCRNSPPILSECRPQRQLRRVTGHKGRVAAPGWVRRWATEIEGATGNADLRQSDGLGNTVADAEIGGVELRIRQRGAGEAIQTEAHLIDATGRMCASRSARRTASAHVVMYPKPGMVFPRPAGLYGLRAVDAVVTVQLVASG